jgi:putative flippase GtrA
MKRLIKYSIGGLTAFFIDMLLIMVFVRLGLGESLSIILAFMTVSLTFSFLFHKNVTFEASTEEGQYSKFSFAAVMVLVVDVGLSILFTKILIHFYLGHYDHEMLVMAGKTLGASVGGLLHFLFMHTWVFSADSGKNKDETSSETDPK